MSASVPPPLPVKAPSSWWQRYWIWLAGLGGAVLVTLIVVASMAAMKIVTGKLRESEPYRFAMAAAQSNPAVAEALGSPLKMGTLISGTFNGSTHYSFFHLSLPISGPKGKGVLQVAASRQEDGDEWTYTTLQVVVTEPKQTILLNKTPPPPE